MATVTDFGLATGNGAAGVAVANGQASSTHAAAPKAAAVPDLSSIAVEPPALHRLAGDLVHKIEAVLDLTSSGIKLSTLPAAHGSALSALSLVRTIFMSPQGTNDILQGRAEGADTRSHYGRIVTAGLRAALGEANVEGTFHQAIAKFLGSLHDALNPTYRYTDSRPIAEFESAVRDFNLVLDRVDVQHGTAVRHAEFRDFVRSEVDVLRAKPLGDEFWKVSCHDDIEAFARKFPSGDQQREAIANLKRIRDAEWARLLT